MNFRNKLHWFIYPIFALSCARQTTPTGGPKDTIPPSLVSAIPRNGQTNYNGKTVELTFDEMLILNNPKEQIIITPDPGKDLQTEVKKNKIIIRFKDNLIDNTTYSINYRDAVQDITEKNPVTNLKIAFSTGEYIDSLSIEGKIYDLLKSTDLKEATVALYQSDTFNIFQHKPVYFTKSDLKGNYKIENLKPGDYYIYALNDKNKNLVVDSKSESYGFLSTKISLNQNTKEINIPLVSLDSRPLKITSARPTGTYFTIKTSKNLAQYKLKQNSGPHLISSFGEDNANIIIYNTIGEIDSLAFQLHMQDSIENAIDTTIYLKFSKRELKAEPFKTANEGFKVIGTKGSIYGNLTFTKPLLKINFDSMYYQIDSTTIIKLSSENITLDSPNNKLFIHKTFDKTLLLKKTTKDNTNKPPIPKTKTAIPKEIPKTKKQPKISTENQLYFSKGSFISIEQDSSKQIKETLTPTTLESTGVIIVHVKTTSPNYILQLLTKDYQVISSTQNTQKSTFEDLSPTDYQIRLIIDENNDGKWNPGNYYLKRQPEPILYYRNEKGLTNVNLKANWEIGPLLINY